jgi:hypothetical protein
MSQEIMQIVFSALGVLVTGLVGWLTTYLTKLLSQKIKDKNLANWLTQITEIILNAVKVTYQVYVEALKDKNMFDAEAQKEALERAYKMVLSQLTDDAKNFIKENYGDIETWIKTQIESAIYTLKNK